MKIFRGGAGVAIRQEEADQAHFTGTVPPAIPP